MEKEKVLFVVLGGTGDLTTRKLFPAFTELIEKELIDKNSVFLGMSRKDFTDSDYKEFLVKNSKIKDLKDIKLRYLQGDFTDFSGIKSLKEFIHKNNLQNLNRIYYLSTSFNLFPNIVNSLKKNELHKSSGFTRIVFEKPFGSDLSSSNLLDNQIHKIFDEKEIYRIDHYLGKETIRNINIMKFANPILYSTFSNEYIDSIEVIVDEDLGVEDRINYYNEAGAVRDMIQNHLLQVLSIALMECPPNLSSDSIHDEKIKILKKLEISGNNIFGQYEGYKKELEKKGFKDKKTETFANIELNCKAKRWDGVKLILRTGKKLKRKYGQININFKIKKNPFMSPETKNNKITIEIYPKQDVNIYLNTRDPVTESIKRVNFEFCRDCNFGPNSADEYSFLLSEVIKGNKILFARSDEIRECWKIADKIQKIKKKSKLIYYEEGSSTETFLS